MKILFRADASIYIGSGHIMRCLTLADELKAKGCEIIFICRELSGNLISLIEKKNYSVCKLEVADESKAFNWENDADETINWIEKKSIETDLIVIDHYQLDSRWESQLRSYTKKIMVIDDLANRHHDCDFLLDQNYYQNMETRYGGLVSFEATKFLGPTFALLREQFYRERESLSERNGEVNNILIFMGGGDSFNTTTMAIKAVQQVEQDIKVNVVIGGANPYYEEVDALCATLPNVNLHIQVENMAELMVQADLAIGAGGATTWERCYLGLPSITLVFAENQVKTTMDLASLGVINFLGWAHECTVHDIATSIQTAIDSPSKMKEMSSKSMRLMGDGIRKNSSLVLDILSL
ncbi:MAG: UDP-2,4-diacetamido-2,4,6-trideoxy-beta-L-altropyranose hydrolase [Gammaproteobacteria bacterium]|nr:UDP-2,4-diacetamido-2,4,6-trideoxy-beta-L-altropyranose hydrolase [Gammaproteobacteria bacterium]